MIETLRLYLEKHSEYIQEINETFQLLSKIYEPKASVEEIEQLLYMNENSFTVVVPIIYLILKSVFLQNLSKLI